MNFDVKTCLLAAATVILTGTMSANAADLRITVKGNLKADDVIYYGLFNRSAGFTDPSKTHAAKTITAKGNSAVAVFKGLKPGNYAIATYNDQNRNHKLDKSLFGAPKEPYGFSNNAKGSFGPPSFEKAAVKIGGNNLSISIRIAN